MSSDLHLADAFIQSTLQGCIHIFYIYTDGTLAHQEQLGGSVSCSRTLRQGIELATFWLLNDFSTSCTTVANSPFLVFQNQPRVQYVVLWFPRAVPAQHTQAQTMSTYPPACLCTHTIDTRHFNACKANASSTAPWRYCCESSDDSTGVWRLLCDWTTLSVTKTRA